MSDEWIDCVLVKLRPESGASFGIRETLEDAERDFGEMVTGEYVNIKFNYNRGQPLIKQENGSIVTIVDIDKDGDGGTVMQK
jgi:hypothetical protein